MASAPDAMLKTYTVDTGDGHQIDIQGPPDATPEQLWSVVQSQRASPQAAPITDSGLVGGFKDQDPHDQASSQLSDQETKEFYHLLQGGADAETLRNYVAGKGHALTNADDIVAQRDKLGRVVGSINYPLPKPEDGTTAGGAAVRGIVQGGTLGFGDELAGGVDAAKALFNGGDPTAAYDQTVDQERGKLAADEEQHPYASIAGNLYGGFAVPVGLEKAGVTASMEAVGLAARNAALMEGHTEEQAARIASRAITRRMAAEGATYGGAYGAGTSDGTPGQRLLGGVTGALEGGAGGAALGTLAPTLGRLSKPATNDVEEAAGRLGIADKLQYADSGGPVARGLTAFAAQTPFGAPLIIKAASALNKAGEGVAESQAAKIGDAATDVEGLGTAATEGAQKYNQIARRAGGRMYDTAARLAGDASVDLASTRDVVDGMISRLKAVPGGAEGLPELQSLRADLNNPASVQAVRDMRTEMFVPQQWRGTPVEGRLRQVVNAASKDVENSLRSQGLGDAADAYRAADDNWRQMLVNLKRNIEPIIGKLDNLKSPEAVATALNSAMKNNGGRVGTFINSLPDEQQKIVRASMINPLGFDRDGNFSLSQFANDWGKISPIAKRAVFGNETNAALNDLATVGTGAKAAKAYGNHSNTARAVITDRTIGTLATGASAAGGLVSFVATSLGQAGLGTLLAYPRFTRWLARSPRTALGALAYTDRLGRIAKAEPAIAARVLDLKQNLEHALSVAPQKLAAQPGNGDSQ